MSLVIRDNIKINSVPGSGTGEPILTRAASTGIVGKIGAIDTSTFISTTLTSGRIIVGNSSNVATGVAMSGVIAISNTGVTSHVAGSIVNADVNAAAAVALTKLAATTASRLLVSDASGFITPSTVTSTEAGYLSGVTSAIQTQLESKVTNSFTTNRALTSNGSGNVAVSAVTSTELGYLSGVTSAVQTQLSAKQPAIQFKDEGSDVGSLGSTTVIDFVGAGVSTADVAGTVTVTISGTANGVPAGGTASQIITKVDGTDYNTQWSTLTTSLITDISASASDLNLLTGLNSFGVTTSELEKLDGVTSNIQAQLDAKRGGSLTSNYIWVGNGSNESTPLAPGSNGTVLTISGGAPVWAAPSTNGHVIQENTTPLTDRPNLNFGAGLTATDNAGTTTTDVVLDTSFGILTTRGDILIRNSSNVTARLAVGSSGYILTSDGTDVSWAAPSTVGHIIEAAGTPLTQRANLNVTNGLTASDNSPDTDFKLGGTTIEDTTIEGDYGVAFIKNDGDTYNRVRINGNDSDIAYFNGGTLGSDETYESLVRATIPNVLLRWSKEPGVGMYAQLGGGHDTDSGVYGFHIYGSTSAYAPAASDLIFRIQPDKTMTLNLGADARGDIYARNSSGNFSRIAKGSEGTILRAGADDPAWSTLTVPNTISALSLLVANSANTLTGLTLTAGQSVRLNAGGTAFEGYTPGGSGVGGSTGATDNSILRADGTGGSTIQASSLFIDDSGNLTLGTASLAGDRAIIAVNSTSDAILSLSGQAGVNITFASQSTKFFSTTVSGNSVHAMAMGNNASGPAAGGLITINNDGSGSVKGGNLWLVAGTPGSGNNNGGDIYLKGGETDGTGKKGNVGISTTAIADWKNMGGGVAIVNAGSAPTAGIANSVALWSADVSSSSELFVMNEAGIKTQISGALEYIQIACSDLTTALTTGTGKAYFRMPFAMTLTGVRASVLTAPTDANIIVDINESGSTILSTRLSIDASEKTSTTATTPAVISDASLADDAEITFDIDQVGSTIAGAGLIVTLIGYRTV